MNNIVRVLVSLSLLVSMSGCAMKTVYDIDSSVTVGSLGGASLVVEDNRPQEEKEKSYGSILLTSSNYGIWTLGDESFKPAPIEALRQRVMKSAAARKAKPGTIKVDVRHLIVQDNQQAYLLRDGSSSLGPLGVAIAEALHGKAFEMDYDKTKPFVIAFFQAEVTIDGHTRSITLTKANNYSSNVDTEGRAVATRKTVDDFFGQVGDAVVGK